MIFLPPGILQQQIVSGGNGGGSAFDAAIAALLPEAWYKFDDVSFATTLVDSGSEGQDMTSRNATDASIGAALRTTRSQSLSMPDWWYGDWAADAAWYRNDSTNLSALISASEDITVIISLNMPDVPLTSAVPVFRIAAQNTSSGNRTFSLELDAAEKYVVRWTTNSFGFNSLISPTAIDDGITHLCIWRDGSGPGAELEIDGAIVDSKVNQTFRGYTEYLHIGGAISTGANGGDFRSDCMAVWDRCLSDAEIADLWTLYSGELV